MRESLDNCPRLLIGESMTSRSTLANLSTSENTSNAQMYVLEGR